MATQITTVEVAPTITAKVTPITMEATAEATLITMETTATEETEARRTMVAAAPITMAEAPIITMVTLVLAVAVSHGLGMMKTGIMKVQ